MADIEYNLDKEGISNLACAVVLQAVKDWRSLIHSRAFTDDYYSKEHQVNFDELRKFFTSDWVELLTHGTAIKPAVILEVLEKELADAQKQYRNGAKRKWT